jgi:hypothetical protein
MGLGPRAMSVAAMHHEGRTIERRTTRARDATTEMIGSRSNHRGERSERLER